jgi:LacI family transcriptional regulator
MQIDTKTKIDQLYDGLKSRINNMSKGERFLSVREAMNEYRVSQVTVDKAMMKLSDEGLLIRMPKVGTFVSDPDLKKNEIRKHRFGIAVPNYPSSIYETYISHISHHIQQKGEVTEIIRYDWQDRVVTSLPKRQVDGLVIIPTGLCLTPEDLYRISQFNIPTVLIGRVLRGVTFDCVEPDNEIGGELVAEHLIKLGHSKLAMLLAEPAGVSTESRIKGFHRIAENAGIKEITVIDCQTKPGENAALKAYEVLQKIIDKNGCFFTGLFVMSDGSALGALKALHDAGILIPKEVSVVGFDDIPESQLYYPALTTVRGDYDQVSQTAVDIIERRLAGDKTEAIQLQIPPQLVVRESTSALIK